MSAWVEMISRVPFASAFVLVSKVDAWGIGIIIILLGGSVYVWSAMISKLVDLNVALRASQKFLRLYRSFEHPADSFLQRGAGCTGNPLLAVYSQACTSLEAVLQVQGVDAEDCYAAGTLSRIPLSDRQIRSVQNAAERTVAEQALALESHMGNVASAASMAPFLGLLGTVMGVMKAFGSMAGSGTALLSEVAPGISSALLTTVVGLFVALPSSLGYNILSDRVRRLTVMMDNFAQELVGDLERVHVS